MKNCIPEYLTLKKNVVWTVCGTALFAELFILIYQPFGSAHWTDNPFIYLGAATAVVLTAMGIIAISRTIMYKYAKKHPIHIWEYSIWIASEVVAMTIVYSLAASVITGNYSDYMSFFKEALFDTILIIFIPYAIFTMSFALIAKEEEINRLKAELQRLAESEVATAENANSMPAPDTYNFRDEKGELKLSVKSSAVYYIESSDNYVIIYYRNGNKLPHYVLRNTLKRIEQDFAQTSLVRCSRSHIVNFNTIKVVSKTDDGLSIDFGEENLPRIPVSKTYSARFLEKFS